MSTNSTNPVEGDENALALADRADAERWRFWRRMRPQVVNRGRAGVTLAFSNWPGPLMRGYHETWGATLDDAIETARLEQRGELAQTNADASVDAVGGSALKSESDAAAEVKAALQRFREVTAGPKGNSPDYASTISTAEATAILRYVDSLHQQLAGALDEIAQRVDSERVLTSAVVDMQESLARALGLPEETAWDHLIERLNASRPATEENAAEARMWDSLTAEADGEMSMWDALIRECEDWGHQDWADDLLVARGVLLSIREKRAAAEPRGEEPLASPAAAPAAAPAASKDVERNRWCRYKLARCLIALGLAPDPRLARPCNTDAGGAACGCDTQPRGACPELTDEEAEAAIDMARAMMTI